MLLAPVSLKHIISFLRADEKQINRGAKSGGLREIRTERWLIGFSMNRLNISCSSKYLLLSTRSRVFSHSSRMEPAGIMTACNSRFMDASSPCFLIIYIATYSLIR